MKKLVLLVTILITGLTVFSQGIDFQKGRYAEVLEMAKKQNKLKVILRIYIPHGVDLVSTWRIMYSRKLKSANIITLIS